MTGIKFRQRTCRNMYGNYETIQDNQISLYVVLTHKCNAHCKFCEFTHGDVEVDIKEFAITLDKLLGICYISMVHFTGGEPTTEIEKLKELLNIVKTKDRLITTSVNTNGYNLSLLDGLKELDNISLSRHAIPDEDNYNIFGCKNIPSTTDIQCFKDKHKLHISCNLIKGYIDSNEKIMDYMEFASKLGVNDIGLVSLMQINEYCKEHYVEFDEGLAKESDRITKSNCFCNDESGSVTCKCENYLYRAQNCSLISAYHRYAIKSNQISDYLVYENNILKQGFNGEPIGLGR